MAKFTIANEEQIFEIEWPDDFCGPDQLVYVVCRARQVFSAAFPDAFSETGMLRLIQLAYRASLRPEEGKYLRFRLYTSVDEKHLHAVSIISFDEPVVIDSVDVLQKLAPATTIHNFALAITEKENKLYCTGVLPLSIIENNMRYFVGLPQLTPGAKGGPSELVVRVDGPGEIRITHIYPTFRLRGGQIKALFSFAAHPIIKDWFVEISDHITGTSSKEMRRKYFHSSLRDLLRDVISQILGLTLANNHGGTFVVLPNGVFEMLSFQDIIIPNYHTSQLDITSAICEFYNSSQEYLEGKRQSVMDPTMIKWSEARRTLLELVEAIANMANIDGCVVLDRQLHIKGFGGRIISERGLKRCVEVNPVELGEEQEISITKFGTRHGSAFNICCKYPGTLAFVISQDGDLRVFYGSEHQVLMWEASSWMNSRDYW